MLPDFIVTGAMKCGTTSLHYYLDLHPEIFMSKQKELDFFIAERNWDRGIGWYESNFSSDSKVNGESSTSYSKYPSIRRVPQRMHSVVPKVKLIYVVRDPIERIISHYIHEYAQGREARLLDEALAIPKNNPYVDTSRYYLQLLQFLEFYNFDRILVITAEDLRDRRFSTLRKVFRFLNVDDQYHSEDFSRLLNRSAEKRRKNWMGHLTSKISVRHYTLHVTLPANSRRLYRFFTGTRIDPPTMSGGTKRNLIASLRPDVDSLRHLTGMAFDRWCL